MLVTGIAALTLFLQAFDCIDMWFQSQVKSKYTVLAQSAGLIVANLLRILAIMMKAPVTAFAAILVIDVTSRRGRHGDRIQVAGISPEELAFQHGQGKGPAQPVVGADTVGCILR